MERPCAVARGKDINRGLGNLDVQCGCGALDMQEKKILGLNLNLKRHCPHGALAVGGLTRPTV